MKDGTQTTAAKIGCAKQSDILEFSKGTHLQTMLYLLSLHMEHLSASQHVASHR